METDQNLDPVWPHYGYCLQQVRSIQVPERDGVNLLQQLKGLPGPTSSTTRADPHNLAWWHTRRQTLPPSCQEHKQCRLPHQYWGKTEDVWQWLFAQCGVWGKCEPSGRATSSCGGRESMLCPAVCPQPKLGERAETSRKQCFNINRGVFFSH